MTCGITNYINSKRQKIISSKVTRHHDVETYCPVHFFGGRRYDFFKIILNSLLNKFVIKH